MRLKFRWSFAAILMGRFTWSRRVTRYGLSRLAALIHRSTSVAHPTLRCGLSAPSLRSLSVSEGAQIAPSFESRRCVERHIAGILALNHHCYMSGSLGVYLNPSGSPKLFAGECPSDIGDSGFGSDRGHTAGCHGICRCSLGESEEKSAEAKTLAVDHRIGHYHPEHHGIG